MNLATHAVCTAGTDKFKRFHRITDSLEQRICAKPAGNLAGANRAGL
jgi:hypothetical protein